MTDDLFPFVYFGLWWFVGGGGLVIMSLLGWVTPPLGPAEMYALSTHGFVLGLVMNRVQSMGGE